MEQSQSIAIISRIIARVSERSATTPSRKPAFRPFPTAGCLPVEPRALDWALNS